MKRGIFTTATAMALVLAQVSLPSIPGFSMRAQAQTAEQQQQEEQVKEEQPQEQPAAEQPAPAPQPQPEAAEAPPPEQPPAEPQQAEQAPAPEPQPEAQQAAPEQPPAEPEPQQQAEPAPEQEPQPAQQPEQTAEQPQQEAAPAPEQQPAPEQTAEQPRKRKKPAAEQQAGTDESPQAAPVAEKPVEQIIQEASKEPPAVVPDEMTDQQRQQLKKAEEKSREEARKRRRELLGAAAAGAAVGALVPLLGGRIVDDRGDRFVVERDGGIYVRSVDSDRFRRDGARVEVEQLRGGRTRETITRRNGVSIITVRDPGGYVLRRVKEFPDGSRVVLFDQRDDQDDRRQHVDYGRRLPPLRIDVPRNDYIVSGRRADRRAVRQTFLAPPVERVESRYTLREVRENERLRDIVRRVDLDTITFAFGSAAVRESEVDDLAAIAGGMLDVIDQSPGALFLVEGHTDAVGSDVDNLILSDRRAESVARVLTDAFGVPPENMVTEGYGEQFLKVNTQAAEQQNRRVTIRNISPLLTSQN